MNDSRDVLVRQLWIDGYEYLRDSGDAQVFGRPADGATVIVPKRERVTEVSLPMSIAPKAPEPSVAHLSPCCNAQSHVRRILGGMTLAIYRCSACGELWELDISRPMLRLVK